MAHTVIKPRQPLAVIAPCMIIASCMIFEFFTLSFIDTFVADTYMANQEDENMTVEKFLEIQFQVILDVSSYSQLLCYWSSFYNLSIRN